MKNDCLLCEKLGVLGPCDSCHYTGKPRPEMEKRNQQRDFGNYTANDSTFPTEVYFANGRKVGIAFDGDKPYLTVSMIDG